jgi:hypothetical protein
VSVPFPQPTVDTGPAGSQPDAGEEVALGRIHDLGLAAEPVRVLRVGVTNLGQERMHRHRRRLRVACLRYPGGCGQREHECIDTHPACS